LVAVNEFQLMEILDDENNADIITWLPHGKGFIIVDKKRFAEETLPTAFKKAKAKFTSFTRKLNRWYGRCVTSIPVLRCVRCRSSNVFLCSRSSPFLATGILFA
jgi:hypothetical protein